MLNIKLQRFNSFIFPKEQVSLVQNYVAKTFTPEGMIADFAIHNEPILRAIHRYLNQGER
jgi:hypothetical protein